MSVNIQARFEYFIFTVKQFVRAVAKRHTSHSTNRFVQFITVETVFLVVLMVILAPRA